MTKKIQLPFCIVFMLLILLPILCVNLEPGGRTAYENRALKKLPKIYDDNGGVNGKILTEFEKWFDDHIGFRDRIIQSNGIIQYYVFNRMEKMPLGPNGELAYIAKMDDYQHVNLMKDKELMRIANSVQIIDKYLEDTNCKLYHMQCWDKHSIYPEQYPIEINQNGNLSLAEQVESYIVENTSVNVVRIKNELIEGKSNYSVYGEWTDPTHWNPRGAFIAYRALMEAINSGNDNKYDTLEENDFYISDKDMGMKMYGWIHKIDITEEFKIRNSKAINKTEKLLLDYPDLTRPKQSCLSINDAVDNRDTLLILGDSYVASFIILPALCETFHKVIMFNTADVMGIEGRFADIIQRFQPKIVLMENAERGAQIAFYLKMKVAKEVSSP